MNTRSVITERDIIKEVGSICACNATHAFSQMINRSILLEAPQLEIVKFKDIDTILQSKDNIVVGVHCQILSGVLGQVSLLFKEKSAYEFVSIFAAKGKHNAGFLTQLGVSTIKEIGNVVVSAYAGAMSLLMEISVIPSIPVLSSGPLNEVIRFGMTNFQANDKILVHTMVFRDNERKISGSFYLVLEPNTANNISEVMRQQLKKIKDIKSKIKGVSPS
ncbi:MAG: chemotaxis protein CheC [Candidatus Omnitrophica bacterium]|jgi:Chemotaxis protein CheC, inhibitor of MCP methylation|nr:chemotaxis protein CheC [Candidatus Omnitrophota bacterium]